MGKRISAILVAILLCAMIAPGYNAQAQATFANDAFKATWQRTDALVGQPGVNRGYYWGPVENSRVVKETYNGVARDVQYFDKSRMEINASEQAGSKFYVVNGRLAAEMVEGRQQIGDGNFKTIYPANIPLASDGNDTNAPTYASFNTLTGKVGDRSGGYAVQTISKDAKVGANLAYDNMTATKYVHFASETGHNIPAVIWDFLNQSGPVSEGGKTVNGRLSDPWFYTTGFPITEPYWANVKIGGTQSDVLIQVFERRVVTYVPAEQAAYRVQMGNIGGHYYDWVYNGAGKPTTPPTQAGSTPAPGSTPLPATPVAQQPDCSGIPASVNATVTPNCARQGTTIQVSFYGFQGGEDISFWITTPDGDVVGTARPVSGGAPASGRISGELPLDPDIFDVSGIWAYTFYGSSSKVTAIARFKVLPASGSGGGAGQPTPVPGANTDVCSQVPKPSGNNTNATPPCADPGVAIAFVGMGFAPGDDVRFYLTAPDQSVVSARDLFGTDEEPTLSVDSSGRVGLRATRGLSSRAPKGVYAMTFQTPDGSKKSICYFGLK